MFTNPEKNIESFFILPGVKVADLGSGSGAYTLAAARLAGDTGRVYAVDVQKELLSKIKKEAEQKHLFNIEVIWGDIEELGGTKLANSSIDVAIISNILFQLEDKATFIKEALRILKPGVGKACVVDWTDSFGGLGPSPSEVVDSSVCRMMFEDGGFKFLKELKDVGAHHYGLVFERP